MKGDSEGLNDYTIVVSTTFISLNVFYFKYRLSNSSHFSVTENNMHAAIKQAGSVFNLIVTACST